MTWDEVIARRVARSWLEPRGTGLATVVGDVGGIHAQVQASAELQLAARVDGVAQTDVRAALWETRSLVKAWTIRGTLHVHRAEELALWLAARKAVTPDDDAIPEWRDPDGVVHPPIAPTVVRRVRSAVWDALDGRVLTREELAAEVGRRVRGAPAARLQSGFAFFLGDLCQGPPRGAKVTLARPDQWVAGWRDVDPQTALREVCVRFVRAFGPTTPAAFQEWFGTRAFRVAQARELFAELGLQEVDVDGAPMHVSRDDTAAGGEPRGVRLLPEYDVYVMGFRERDRLVPPRVRELVAAHGRGRYEGPAGVRFLLVDGVAAGLWERRRRGKRLELEVTPSGRLARALKDAVRAEAERYAAFLGHQLELTI